MASEIFIEAWKDWSSQTPCGSKILPKSLYLARFSRYKHFCVLRFSEKFKNSKWPPFLEGQNFLENWVRYIKEGPCGSKILSKSLYLARFSRYKHFCVLHF